MKKLLKVLAYVDLVLGTIGSFVLANQFGRTLDYSYYLYYSKARYDRNWAATLIIFAAAMFSVLVLYAILNGLSEILKSQEQLARSVSQLSAPQPDTPSASSEAEMHFRTSMPSKSEWKCPQCGKINSDYVGTCGCGQRKPL